MNTDPKNIYRIYPPQFNTRGLIYNRDHATGAGKLRAEDLVWVPELGRFAINYQMAGGLPRYYGPVASEAAMLALHNPEAWPARWVAPGDKCRRTDTGAVMECVSGNGLTAADWIGMAPAELVATVGTLSSNVAAATSAIETAQADIEALETSLGGKQAAFDPDVASALANITEGPLGGPQWKGDAWPDSAGGGGGVLSWADAVSACASSMVHRWLMTETSGTSVADSVGSLTLTITSGSYTRDITSPIGKAVDLTGAYLLSSSVGSVPTGANARTIAIAFKSSETAPSIVSWGTAATRAWINLALYSAASTEGSYSLITWSDDLVATYGAPYLRDSQWHLAILRYNGASRLSVTVDGVTHSRRLGASLNTTAAAALYFGAANSGSVGATGTWTCGEIMAWTRALTNVEVSKLSAAFLATLT